MSDAPASAPGIAVVGMACRYPGARDPRQLWENVLSRRREFRRIPDCRLPLGSYFDPDPRTPDKTYATRAALLDGFTFDWVQRRIPRATYESADVVHWLALETALAALDDTGRDRATLARERAGVFVGNTLTGEQTRSQSMRLRWPFVQRVLQAAACEQGMSEGSLAQLTRTMETLYKSVFGPITEDSLAGGLSNTIAGRICNVLDFHGGGYTVDGACSSSLIAVATAAAGLLGGELDLALAGGVDVSLDTFELIGFAKMGALTTGEMAVYDRRASGFLAGEGCGFVVLKRLADARRDGDFVYAVLRGWGISSDGRGGIAAPSAAGQARALRRAYARAPYSATELDFIEGHGTGTAVGDPVELEGIALCRADGEAGAEPPLRSCGVTSFKSIVGHTKAAAGIGGFIKAVCAVNRRVVPPTAGCRDPHPAFEGPARALYPVLLGERCASDRVLRAGVTGAGFGGINCHVTLESADPPAPRLQPALDERALLASHQTTELFVLAAGSRAGLRRRIVEIRRLAEGMSLGELPDLAATLAGGLARPPATRGALLAASPEELLSRLDELDQLAGGAPRPGGRGPARVWLGEAASTPRLGFLFPGQGSQALNMARVLVERHDWAREAVLQAAAVWHESTPEPIASRIFRPVDRALDSAQLEGWLEELTRSEIAQPAICLAALLWLARLRRLGLVPAAVGGHSLGELVAFHAAGAYDAPSLLRLAALRGRAMAAPGKAGTMVGLSCDLETAEALAARVPGYVVVANVNGPRQIVLSGEPAAVAAVAVRAAAEGIAARTLRVANAFHSRLVAAAAEQLRRSDAIPATLGETTSRLFSALDGDEVRSGHDLREHVARQVLARVDFVALVRQMAGACDLLVEVGPGRVLSSLAREIVGSDGIPCLPVESRSGHDEDLNRLLGVFFVGGGNPDWNALYADRLIRPFVPAERLVFIGNPCENPLPAGGVTRDDRGANLGAWGEPLAEATGMAPERLGEYLRRRAGFLAGIIRADASPEELEPPAAPAVEPPLPQAAEPLAAPPEAAASASRMPQPDESGSLEAHTRAVETALLGLTARLTGFPEETLTPEQRLIDDLNLDSIKASSLIAEAARGLGIAGRLDPATFGGASLGDIASALARTSWGGEAAPVLEPASSPFDGSRERLLATARQLGMAGGLESAASLVSPAREPWVRDFALRLVEAPLPLPGEFAGPAASRGPRAFVLVCAAGERPLAEAIARRLGTAAGTVAEVRAFEDLDGVQATDLVTIIPRAAPGSPAPEPELRQIVGRLAAVLTLPLAEPGEGRSSLCFIELSGGGLPPRYTQSAAAALAASVHLERPELQVRVLDFNEDAAAESVAEALARELATPEGFVAAGYDHELTRRVGRLAVLDPSTYGRRAFEPSGSDVILVSGGARGVTAECALALARETGAKLALLGRSPETDAEVAHTLARFAEAGLTCRYYRCDVTDAAAVRGAVARVHAELGPITGLLHGAGANHPRLAAQVPAEQAFLELAPKVLGALHLLDALETARLGFVAGLTSIIGVTGMPGNAWYAFANQALDRILGRHAESHPETAVLSAAFGAWGEVGMAPRMGLVERLRRLGTEPISTAAGTRRFLRLLRRDPGCRQVVITSQSGELDTLGFDVPRGSDLARHLPPARFLEQIRSHTPGVELVARAHLTLAADRYLEDHRWRGSHLLPLVFGLEAMAQAVASLTGEARFEHLDIVDVRTPRPILVDPERGTTIEIRAEVLEREASEAQAGDGLEAARPARRVRIGISTDQGDFAWDHFAAVFVLRDPAVEEAVQEAGPPSGSGKPPGLDLRPEELYGWLLFQGPRFHRLSRVDELDSRHILFWARYGRTPSGTLPDLEHGPWLLGDPYFRDALLQSGQLVLPQDIGLPVSIERIELRRGPREPDGDLPCYSQLDERTATEIRSWVEVRDADGRMLEKIHGLVQRVLERHPDNPTAEELARPGSRDDLRLQEHCRDYATRLGVALPSTELSHEPDLRGASKEHRRSIAAPHLERLVRSGLAAGDAGPIRVSLSWDVKGKPTLEGASADGWQVSISHEEAALLCTAGPGAQGCDIAAITPRSQDDWHALLGEGRQPLLRELADPDGLDRAGTRLWAVAEAARKASQSIDVRLDIEQRRDDAVLFLAQTEMGALQILTFPLTLSRGRSIIVALTASRHA